MSILDKFSLRGRRALVTGGSMSIGRAIALGFAEAGAAVCIQHSAAADEAWGLADAAARVVAELRGLGAAAHAVESDFRQPGAGARTIEMASAALGGIDILVIAASIQYREPFDAVTPARTAEQVAINFEATVDLLQAALPPMAARGWGRVVTIGSINQVRPEPVLAIYAALKSAQQNLCINLAKQYAPRGVLINNLAPGLVATERNRARREDPEDWRRIQAVISPMGRAAQPDEMVGAALLLCSDAGSYIVGADLMITGGGHLP